jgi:hypothetical protein
MNKRAKIAQEMMQKIDKQIDIFYEENNNKKYYPDYTKIVQEII